VTSGTVTSANLLSGSSASSITNFYYNISSLPSSGGASSVTIQFSTTTSQWYSSAGVLGGSDNLTSTGGANLSLTGMALPATSAFYYKMTITSTGDQSGTPVVSDIRLDYVPSSGYGDMLTVNSTTGNVGIGSLGSGNTPSSRLAVQGGATFGSGYFSTNAPTNGILVQGMVGLGTTSPWGLLSLAAPSSNTSPLFTISTSTASATSTAFVIDSNGNLSLQNGAGLTLSSLATAAGTFLAANASGQIIATTSPLSTSLTKGWTLVGSDAGVAQATSSIFISSLGNVGIGTASPSYPLDIGGSGLLANVSKYGWYGINGNLLAYASSTNQDTIFGLGAGGQNATTSAGTGANTAVGYQALSGLTSGSYNAALGWQALFNGSAGIGNNAIGESAMGNGVVTSLGQYNNAIGYKALYNSTSGNGNNAVGYQAMGGSGNVTGYGYNNALGYQAMLNLTSGQNNNAIGAYAMGNGSAITGFNNTALGYQALYNLTTGYDNIMIGDEANAGGNEIKSGHNNILLGYNSQIGTSTSNNTSNFLNIGNSFFGTLVATSTSTTLPSSFANVAFGIATSSPFAELSVSGSPGASMPLFAVSSSTSAYATTTVFEIDQNGFVNIASTSAYQINGVNAISAQTGQNNWFFGGAGNSSPTGIANTGVGSIALANESSGSNNVAVGYKSLYNNTTGSQNTALGYQALKNAFSTNNTAVGYNALYNTSSGNNTAVGTQAGYGVGSGNISNSTLIGYQAGYTLGTSANNLFIGYSVASTTTTGSNNIAIGYDIATPSITSSNTLNIGNIIFGTGINGEGMNLSTGNIGIGTTSPATKLEVGGDITDDNILSAPCLGTDANGKIIATVCSGGAAGVIGTTTPLVSGEMLYASGVNSIANSSAMYFTGTNLGIGTTTPNSIFGVNQLIDFRNADYSTFLGYQAGMNYLPNAGLGNSTFVGYQAGLGGTVTVAAVKNVGVGMYTLKSTTSGNNNSAVGYAALFSDNSGIANLGIGSFALYADNSGSNNVSIGQSSSDSNTTGNNNVVNGASALYYSTTGSNNTVLGTYAGFGVSTNVIASSTILGYKSGYTLGGTGSIDNILLGVQAGYSLTTGGNNIVIGYNTDLPTITTSNTLDIGNLIYATGLSNFTAPTATVGTGNVGIGTTTPWGLLSVNGNALATNVPQFVVGSSTATNFIVTQAGNVGVGTSTATTYNFGVSGTAGGSGSWTTGSYSGYKEDFTDVQVLSKINNLNLKEWQYKASYLPEDTSRHMGPFAEDFRAQFGLGSSDYSVSELDVAGVALKGVQEIGQIIDLKNATTTLPSLTITNSGNIGIGTPPAGGLTDKLTISGNVFANSYEAPQTPIMSFPSTSLGAGMLDSTTTTAEMPAAVLTAAGNVDLYKLATYNLSGVQALAARMDAMDVRMTSLETRVTALENGAVSTASDSPVSLASSSLASAFTGFGAFIQKGIAQFGILVADQFVAATNSAGTSSAGSVTILAGNTVAQVTNSYVLPTSKIFVTLTASTTGSWYISDKQDGSFKLTLSAPQTNDVSFDYFIVQTEGQIATSTPASSISEQCAGDPASCLLPPATSGFAITLLGDNPLHVDVGDTFIDPGVDAGGLPVVTYINGVQQEISSTTIDTSSPTTYIITYSATDAAGNVATALRSVIVGNVGGTISTGDSQLGSPTSKSPPVVTLNGDAALQITVGDTFTDPGATAIDSVDGDLTSKIVETGSVDTSTAGLYTLTYTATDAAGNSANVSRVVTVLAAPSDGAATSTP
jgi:hypothetical protein